MEVCLFEPGREHLMEIVAQWAERLAVTEKEPDRSWPISPITCCSGRRNGLSMKRIPFRGLARAFRAIAQLAEQSVAALCPKSEEFISGRWSMVIPVKELVVGSSPTGPAKKKDLTPLPYDRQQNLGIRGRG